MSRSGRTSDERKVATWRLYLALEQENPAAAVEAVESGADPDADFAGERPLHIAIERGYDSLVRTLLAHGADPNAPRGYVSETPLHVAAATGRIVAVRLLIEAGADLEARTSGGWTPLRTAVDANDLRTVLALLETGASFTARNTAGETVLHIVERIDPVGCAKSDVASELPVRSSIAG